MTLEYIVHRGTVLLKKKLLVIQIDLASRRLLWKNSILYNREWF